MSEKERQELDQVTDELYAAGFNWEQIEYFRVCVECGKTIDAAMQEVFCF